MTWIQLSTYATPEAIDWMRTLLAGMNDSDQIIIATLEKSNSDAKLELLKDRIPVNLYLEEKSKTNSTVNQIMQQLHSLQRTDLITDWQNTSVATLPSLNSGIGQHQVGCFVIVPSDSKNFTIKSNEILLKIGQTFAFGSGYHPATILCLKLLERYVATGMNALDVGCGSGILSVAMAKLGAIVTAIDNDSTAISATQQAIQHNHVTESVTPVMGSLGTGSTLGHWLGGNLPDEIITLQPSASFDLIVANLPARIHASLANDYRNALRQTNDRSALLITAGYDTDYEFDLNAAFNQVGFTQLECDRLDNWVACVHQLAEVC